MDVRLIVSLKKQPCMLPGTHIAHQVSPRGVGGVVGGLDRDSGLGFVLHGPIFECRVPVAVAPVVKHRA